MKNILLRLFLLLPALFLFSSVSATHNRAGEITYVQKSNLTYEITITTFTYTPSFADRPSLDVEWGDNTISTAQRIEMVTLPNLYRKNIYVIEHTYPGPGVYRIIVQDPNRNAGVKNIPNSVNVVFSISTTLIANPAIGRNSTPVLLNPPYDKAAFGHIFIHNPAAYDPDGDSLSYVITTCTREDGKPIENYTLPPATRSITVDPVSGDLIWDTPADTGKFNVAIEIQEWRDGKKIGIVVRDMQIDVFSTTNKPPVIGPLRDWCIEAGGTVDFIATATDENIDGIKLLATSGAFGFADCPAVFIQTDSTSGSATGRFTWTPCHQAVRNQPYNVIFKADDTNPEIPLSDIDNMNIKVLGPSPNLLSAIPEGKDIRLVWASYGTDFIAGFSIYRAEGATQFNPDSCTSGLPPSSGFIKVGYINGASATSFTDNNSGAGLQFGREYSYRIVAVYPNGTESKASNEISSSLVSGVPVIRNVSVTVTDPVNGSIFIAWKRLNQADLDTIPAGPNFEYRIFRSEGTSGTSYQLIGTIQTSNLNDTTFTDTGINTLARGYLYKVELWNNDPSRTFLIGEPGIASSVYLSVLPGDRKAYFVVSRNVPWINTRYDLYRLNDATSLWELVGSSNQLNFTDLGLVNGQQYCYYVSSFGGYPALNMPKELVNLSERICVTPVDNEAPCIPPLRVTSQCDSLYNTLTWTVSDPECLADIAGYRLYYRPTNIEELSLIADLADRNTFVYRHYPENEIIAGCYAIATYDAIGNESEKSVIVCIDSCDFYEIPNVFTPNNDGFNDRLIAKTSGLVERVDFKLYNRNGLLIFQTQDPRLNWDGTYNGRIVSPGVYFYSCDVYERRITGLELFHLSGFVHVITEKDSEIPEQLTK